MYPVWNFFENCKRFLNPFALFLIVVSVRPFIHMHEFRTRECPVYIGISIATFFQYIFAHAPICRTCSSREMLTTKS